jgi:sugar phosphate permease
MTGSVVSGFNGIISYGLSTLEGKGGLQGWRWIFIVPGIITVALAVPIFLFVSDFPEKAAWLSPDDLARVRERLEEDRGETLEDKMTFRKALAALSDWKVWLLSSLLFFVTTGSYTMAFFTPSILASFGFNVAMSQILITPPAIFAAFCSIGTAVWADRIQKRSPFIVGYLLLTVTGFVMIGWGNNTGCKLTGIFFAVAGVNCATPTVLTFLANNVVGTSKRQIAVPLQTSMGGLGGIAGSLLFREQDYPKYRPGLYAAFTSMSCAIMITLGLTLYFRRENKKADKEGKILEGLEGFRYTL